MDYETRPASRNDLRILAKLFRVACGLPSSGAIDPVALLDRLPDIEGFSDVRYEVVYNNELDKTVPAQCTPYEDGYLIQIKESTYDGAFKNKTGGLRMHIIHEIVHAFVDKLGFKPNFTRRVTKETPFYCRLEWIVMALAGEIMMPYEETQGLTEKELMQKYGVSKAAAQKRLKY